MQGGEGEGWVTAAELDALMAEGDTELLQELAGYHNHNGDGWGVNEMAWLGSMQLMVRELEGNAQE